MDYMKWIGGGVMLLIWTAIVLSGHATADGAQSLILFIQASLVGLGAHGLTVSGTRSVDGPTTPQAAPNGTLLPNGTARPPLYVPAGQSGKASPVFIITIFAIVFVYVIFAAVVFLAGCAYPPTPGQVNQIKVACAADAGLRPSVDLLLSLPGLAKPEEVLAITSARVIIDPICKNPDSPPIGIDPYSEVTKASALIAGTVAQMEMRKGSLK